MSTYQFPTFEFIELITELEIPFNRRKSLRPLASGQVVSGIALDKSPAHWAHFFNGAATHGHLLLRKLLSKPLVISFYSTQWGEYGVEHLKQLNSLQNEIRAQGGNLLIVTSEKLSKPIEDITWAHSLSLSFYHDSERVLSKAFKVYSEDNPTWDKFSGIDSNIPLLSTYVVDTDGNILFDHVDNSLEEHVNGNELLTAVKQVNSYGISRKSA